MFAPLLVAAIMSLPAVDAFAETITDSTTLTFESIEPGSPGLKTSDPNAIVDLGM